MPSSTCPLGCPHLEPQLVTQHYKGGWCAGVKLVLPAILEGVDDSAWRTKQGSIELLGTMAYLAPKQLSTSLPNVVPILAKTLSDPHPKVQASAKKALEEVHFILAQDASHVSVSRLVDAGVDAGPGPVQPCCCVCLLYLGQ